MPLPVFTEEDYKAAEREIIKGKSSRGNRPGPSGRPVRSLHHIDDEDFEDTRAKALERKARLEAYEREFAEQEAAKRRPSGMKNEDDRPMLSLSDIFKRKKQTGDDGKTGSPAQEEGKKTDTEPDRNDPKNPGQRPRGK